MPPFEDWGFNRVSNWRKQIDRYAAAPMFLITVVFLTLVAGGIQSLRDRDALGDTTRLFLCTMLALWPLFIFELVVHRAAGSRFWRQHLLFCLLPPLRLGARDHQAGSAVWLPWLGWTRVGRDSRKRVEQAFAGPMLVISLLILPVLAIEYYWADHLDNYLLTVLLDTGTSLIWLAFTIEFIVMMAIVDKKLRYAKEHWIDLVVISLPLLAFVRALRLAQLARLQSLGRLTRVYRLRGLTMRAYRGLLALNVLRHVLHVDPKKRLAVLQELEAEKQHELDQLRLEIVALQQQIDRSQPLPQPPLA